MTSSFGKRELVEVFELLDDELNERGIRAGLFVVGGAAMAIAYDTRRTTTDVDAIFTPTSEVREPRKLSPKGLVSNRTGSTTEPKDLRRGAILLKSPCSKVSLSVWL